MVDVTPFLPGLSPVQGKAVVARFDGGQLSRKAVCWCFARSSAGWGWPSPGRLLTDPRAPEKVVHRLAEIIRFRILMIAAGYEDGNDADALRRDPMFKLALDRLPSDEELCSQSTISRLENLPDVRALFAWGGRSSSSIAARCERCRGASFSISTTPSTGCMAASSCACSMPTMTITASSRSLCSTARGVS